MTKQMIFRDEARRRLKAGIDKTAQAVAITLGPKGRYVALDQKWGAPLITHAETLATVLEEPYILLYDQKVKAATNLVPCWKSSPGSATLTWW